MKNAVLTTRLRVLRAERRLSQQDTAAAVAITHNRYWRIENGHAAPTDAEYEALAEFFGVSERKLRQGMAA